MHFLYLCMTHFFISNSIDFIMANSKLYRSIGKIIFFTLISLIGEQAISQNEKIVLGKVVDFKEKAPVKFANVYLKLSQKGTISNEKGEFRLFISEGELSDSLIVSFVGLSPYRKAVSSIASTDTLKIFLLEQVVTLETVEILSLSPLSLLKKSLRNTSLNSISPAILNTYYREFTSKNGHFIKFADAIVDYFITYQSDDFPDIKVRVDESRAKSVPFNTGAKSLGDIDLPNQIDLEVLPRFFDIERKFEVRFNPQEYDFDLTETFDAKVALYKVQFQPKPNIEKVLFSGYFYINKENMIIHSLEYQISDAHKKYIEARNVLGVKFQVSLATVYIKFQMVGEKCHLKYAKAKLAVHVYNKKDYDVTHLFTSEMLVNKISYQDVLPFKKSELYKKNGIYKRGNSFKSNFWEGQQSILTTEEENKIIEELDKKMESTKKKKKVAMKTNPIGEFKSGFVSGFAKQ